MTRSGNPAWRWLALTVAVHVAVTLVHGAAHAWAHVPLSPAARLFVFVVILAAPLAGLALMPRADRLGRWLVAGALAASLVFGVVNHFVLAGPDHVAHVAGRWQPLFATTAVLLAATEALGVGLAIGPAGIRRNMS